jgi:hypothetical protein
MATRFQIIKKTRAGVFRCAVDTGEAVNEIIEIAKADPECLWVVVKDRQRRRRQQVWRRSETEKIEFWWLEE